MITDESILAKINPRLLDISTIDYGSDGVGLNNDEIFEELINYDFENESIH